MTTLSALLAKLRVDAGLQEKLKSAPDLDATLAVVKEAGFVDVSKMDLLKHPATKQHLAGLHELCDEELEGVSCGGGPNCRCLTRHYR